MKYPPTQDVNVQMKDGLATTPEKAARYVEVCQEKAVALERLIADLFAFARIEYLEQQPRRFRYALQRRGHLSPGRGDRHPFPARLV